MDLIAQKTAAWWADKVFTDEPNWDNGTRAENPLMNILASLNMMQGRQKLSSQDKTYFTVFLAEKIIAYKKEKGYYPDLKVDYSPEGILAEVAKELSISESVFPCKTYSSFDRYENQVFGACGYRAEREVIYQA
jgi:hypothetical protein